MVSLSLDKICELITESGAVYWTVKDNDSNRSQIARSPQDAGLSADKSCDLLKNIVDGLSGDYIIITAMTKRKADAEKGGDNMTGTYTWKCELNKKGAGMSGANSFGGMLAMMGEINDLKLQIMKKELADQYEDKKGESSTDKLINKLIDDPDIKKGVVNALNGIGAHFKTKNMARLNGGGSLKVNGAGSDPVTRLKYHHPEAVDILSELADYVEAVDNPAAAIEFLRTWLKSNATEKS